MTMTLDELESLIFTPRRIEMEEEALQVFQRMRRTNPEKFIKSILSFSRTLNRSDPEASIAFIRRWDFSFDETLMMCAQIIGEGWMSWDEARERFPGLRDTSKGLFLEAAMSPKVRILIAINELRHGPPAKKPSEIKRDVIAWMDSYFAKSPKGYSEQQLTDATDWWIATKEKNLVEKNKFDKRSRSRANVTGTDWKAYFLTVFSDTSPPFAADFKIIVQRKARKIKNAKA